MSKKQWIVLLMLFLAYLLLGASMFYHIESKLEIEHIELARQERIEINGQDNTKGSGFFFVMYKTFLIIWISFGLGYIVMIMTFIAQGMRSKKIIRIEHKLAMNLKHTQSKIWNEFNKEISYFRRVFNELQLSKVKRVYVDEYNYETPPTKFSRSNSFPDLRKLIYGGFDAPAPLHPRRRANSEVVPLEPLTRVVSETDLQRIDKTATFAAHAMVQPAELLARLVNVLGYIPPPDDANDTSDWDQEYKNKEDTTRKTGIEGFNEKNILNKQNTWNESSWRIGTEKISGIKPRSRAASEVRLDMSKNDSNVHQQNGEWTWSGPTASRKIQELIKTRRTGLSSIKDNKSYKFPSITLPKSVPKNLFSPWRRQSSSNKKIPDTEQSIQKGSTLPDIDLEAGENYSSITAHSDLYSSNLDDVNESMTTSRHHPYYTHTGANLPSLMESNNILEETSLADFLRALTVLHAKISTVPSDYSNIRKPQRKMGTASLTPPKLPSLFTLFSQSADSQSHSQSNQSTMTASSSLQANRRYSLRPSEYSPASTPSYERRGSVMNPVKSRRFSLRPVATPTSTPPEYTASYLNSRIHDDQRSQFSYLTDAFIYESAKKPLVKMEGTPGVSSPIAKISNGRRYSLRPMTQIQQAPSSNQQTQAFKALPRWKAGMLQRQIGRMSVHRRVRAFSLSDVQADKSDKSTGLSPLAIDDNGKPVTSIISSIKPSASAVQKTVTIVSPTKDEVLRSNSNETTSNPFIPSFATSETPDNNSIADNFPFRNVQNDAINTNIVLNTLQATSECEMIQSNNNERSVENINNSDKGMGEKLIFPNDSVGSKEILNDELALSKDNVVLSNIKDNSENDTKSMIRCNTNEKPRISIHSYKNSLDVKIEKPSVNPFLQYQATTSGSQRGNSNLTDVKVEKTNETEQFVQRKLSAEARKKWEKG
ncbi:PREDICTED: open rectifier potassium channel protein 1 isoform X3 [Polistes dominula]|uniref:Open rectifier potassium channel protein 1 isoform X3 n=1 Tax=Polistes dominula TaxID=743375 RepID=A0ABM1HXP6_POLDO|nr:PREDICTED: open rectifier potassium channel protein 1 isoform X3 [Polistes dominula]